MRSDLMVVFRREVVLGAIAFSAVVSPLESQAPSPVRVEATRAELESIAAYPPKGMSTADLSAVQARLANGDFAVGDRILIQVQGEATLSNTYTVGGDRTILLPSLPPLSLVGVLRSESDSVVREFIGRYVRDPQVTVQALIRLGVLGGVGKPGYYDVAAQSLLSEVVMGAGGIAVGGRMDKTAVWRGNTEVLDPKAVNMAITNGITLDLLNMQSGDNIQVGVDKAGGALTKVQIVTGLLAIPIMIFTISALAGN
jgi:protein involved in polysaccharide export with SLBB domain